MKPKRPLVVPRVLATCLLVAWLTSGSCHVHLVPHYHEDDCDEAYDHHHGDCHFDDPSVIIELGESAPPTPERMVLTVGPSPLPLVDLDVGVLRRLAETDQSGFIAEQVDPTR